jgi:hypothetical protein
MVKNTRGGRRDGAGRPKADRKRESRHIKLFDEEWSLIRENAAKKGMSPREYIYKLVENDSIPD